MVFHHAQLLANIACLVFCTCATVTISSTAGTSVTMVTSYGNVTGSVVPGVEAGEDDVNVFYGIPFAKPPLGDLRFKAPQPPDRWNGSMNATTPPNSCWQALDAAFDRFPGVEMWNPNTPRSEDCLYLNAWVPSTSTSKPIMVWIFGGGFWAGTTTLDVYDAIKLAAKNDVIVVSIAYRLGAFGFLYAGAEFAPGNVGMLDQVMALEWIKDNAENMGGDPSKITLFGESAGAASIGYHLLSPLSRDLFNNGIMLSSTALVNWGVHSRATSLQRFKKLSADRGCKGSDSDLVSCLRNVSASDLADSQWGVVSGVYFDCPFAVVVDDHFLLERPNKLVEEGMIKDADIMAGVVKNEGIYWLLYGFADVFSNTENNPVNRTQFLSVIDGIISQYNLTANEMQIMKAEDDNKSPGDGDGVYMNSALEKLIKGLAVVEYHDGVSPMHRMDYLNALDAMSGDVLFKCAVQDYCTAHREHQKGKVFMYSFDHRVTTNPWPSWLGVAHGYEIEIMMGLPFLHVANYTADERALSERSMQFLSNFAKTGDPNQGSQSAISSTPWPEFDLDTQYYHILDINDSNADGMRYRLCKFWDADIPLLKDQVDDFHDNVKQCPDAGFRLSPAAYVYLFMVLMSVVGVQLWNLRS